MAKSPPEQAIAASTSPEPTSEKKRKRTKSAALASDEELEIDITLPEPPSKKAKRAEKKRKSTGTTTTTTNEDGTTTTTATPAKDADDSKPKPPDQRSDHSIWIGNLPWTCTKDSLRAFLLDEGGIMESSIARLHMPPPVDKPVDKSVVFPVKPMNKGFAYVDFTTRECLEKAMGLSEKMMKGRRVLIKDAKSFAGRPEKKEGAGAELADGNVSVKPPAKRIWVGNLSFDVTKEGLEEHFAQAGEVEDVMMATFEDSGKCKGFGWVTFKELEAAEAAVRGFIYKKVEEDDEEESSADEAAESGSEAEEKAALKRTKKPAAKKANKKGNKYHINRLLGRELRREFAEDAQTRYKKRYGNPNPNQGTGANSSEQREPRFDSKAPRFDNREPRDRRKGAESGELKKRPDNKEERQAERRKRHERAGRVDARTVAPGQALASAKRNTGAIVEGKGKKVVF